MSGGLVFALVCALIALAYGAYSITWIMAQPAGNARAPWTRRSVGMVARVKRRMMHTQHYLQKTKLR